MNRAAVVAVTLVALAVRASAPEPDPGHAVEEAEAEPFLEYNVDFVLGFTDFDTYAGVVGEPALPTFEKSRLWTTSLLLGAEHPTPQVTFGVRLPVLVGGVTALEGEPRSRVVAPMLGNLELEATHREQLSHAWSLAVTFELALPTAMGEEPPLEGEVVTNLDAAAVTRGEVLRSAEFSRGSLDSTLFEPGRLGFIPKLSFDCHWGEFHLRPTAKFELLFDTRGRAREHLIAEFVGGVRMSYEFAHLVEPYVHAWTNITVSEHVERNVDVVLLEPGVQFRAGKLRPGVGVVLPLFGRLLDDRAFGVRVGLAGEI